MRKATPYNVIAAFRPGPEGMVRAIGGLTRCGVSRSAIKVQEMSESEVLVAVHVADRTTATWAALVMRDLGGERIHFVDGRGLPLPPRAEHPGRAGAG